MTSNNKGDVKMVITEEKIMNNIEKVQKMINPKSKKQIVKLEDDNYFVDLIASIKAYLEEYPKDEKFPRKVYNAAYDLVEYATEQFEENTKKIEDLIRTREANIALAMSLRETLKAVQNKESNWKKKVQEISSEMPQDIVDSLGVLGRAKSNKSQNYVETLGVINTKINNLESNAFIEIDMERIEDRSKALSYIGIEIAESLKEIKLIEEDKEQKNRNINEIEEPETAEGEQEEIVQDDSYLDETRVEVKKSLWDRIKNMKLIRGIRYLMKIKVVLELPESTETAESKALKTKEEE